MRKTSQVLLALTLVTPLAKPVAAQSDDQFWRNQWFWGAQAGALIYSAGGNQEVGLGVGGHWFITADHTALSIAFDQLILSNSQIALGSGQLVDFSRAQRISATVNAMPGSGSLRPFIGLGFSIQHVTNSAPQGPFATPQAQTSANLAVEELATKAFLILGGGIQYRLVGKWVLFGQYQFQPSTNDFLITSGQHAIQGGIRYALTGSKEEVDAMR